MLDINIFREDRGGNPELVRESQRRRFADVGIVDEIVATDAEFRQALHERNQLRTDYNAINKQVGMRKKNKEDADDLIAEAKELDRKGKELEARAAALEQARDSKLKSIGNIVPDSVPVAKDEAENVVVATNGDATVEKPMIHVDIMQRLDWIDTDAGTVVAGGRGYFLKNEAVLLNQALINFGLGLLCKRGYTPLQTPFFMNKEMMQHCAQLEEFDEELYHVSAKSRGPDGKEEDSSNDKYLIATSEQPISCYHFGQRLGQTKGDLPKCYAGYSTCFRKEAGAHGRDTAGIFRIHQFEKVEQFVLCEPSESYEHLEKMLAASREFYDALGIPYRVVNMVSGALNNAAAKKYDLEAWFPGSRAFRELCSLSNCTDFQSRRLEVRCGVKVKGETEKLFVHMLNGTLCATERAMCCLVETYQTEDGVRIPEALQPYMHGITEVKWRQELKPVKENKPSKKGGK
jgi:seryl-tRNA synthetase